MRAPSIPGIGIVPGIGLSSDARAVTQQACSVLLGYPDEQLLSEVPLLAEAVASLPGSVGGPLTELMDHMHDVPLETLQEHYVQTFDMRRRCSLFLSYWTHGDTRNRGVAILRFKQAYLAAGIEPSPDELPDHLAVVLEFAARVDREAGNELLAEHRGPIELLRDSLSKVESPYVHVLDAVVVTLPALTPEREERARRLAAEGPPTEMVGLAPFSITPTDPTGAPR